MAAIKPTIGEHMHRRNDKKQQHGHFVQTDSGIYLPIGAEAVEKPKAPTSVVGVYIAKWRAWWNKSL